MIHCLGLPLLIAALPALANRFDPGEGFHLVVLAFAIPSSGLALIAGWRRHRLFVPLAFGGVGLSLMAVGVAVGDEGPLEVALTMAGSLLVAAAHLVNWRARRRRIPATA